MRARVYTTDTSENFQKLLKIFRFFIRDGHLFRFGNFSVEANLLIRIGTFFSTRVKNRGRLKRSGKGLISADGRYGVCELREVKKKIF